MEIIFASHNLGKVNELKTKLCDHQIIGLKDLNFEFEIEETGNTLEENALIKAKFLSDIYNDKIIISDDSGLFVGKINNEPGVSSARYADDDPEFLINKDLKNCNKVISKLQGEESPAKFITVICLIIPNKNKPFFFQGELSGMIKKDFSGNDGFGYDPIFYVDDISLASRTLEEKNTISHRAKAIEKLSIYLKEHNV